MSCTMGDQPTIQVCNNCKREVSSVNFVMHMAHCSRHQMVICDQCDSAFPSAELQAHVLAAHADVLCPMGCGLSLSKNLLDDHKSNKCPKRTVPCQFCEMETSECDLVDHEDYCGSRTSRCTGCGRYVMDKFMLIHLDSDHTFLSLDEPDCKSTSNVQEAKTDNDLCKRTNGITQGNLCGDLLEKVLMEKPKILGTGAATGAIPKRFGVSEAYRDSSEATLPPLPREGNLWNGQDPPVEKNSMAYRHNSSNRDQGNSQQHKSALADFAGAASWSLPVVRSAGPVDNGTKIEASDMSTIPCELCGEQIAARDFLNHQQVCQLDVGLCAVAAGTGREPRTQLSPAVHIVKDSIARHSTSTNGVDCPLMIPCEYCGLCYPDDCFVKHEMACAHRFRHRPSSDSDDNESVVPLTSHSLVKKLPAVVVKTAPPVASLPSSDLQQQQLGQQQQPLQKHQLQQQQLQKQQLQQQQLQQRQKTLQQERKEEQERTEQRKKRFEEERQKQLEQQNEQQQQILHEQKLQQQQQLLQRQQKMHEKRLEELEDLQLRKEQYEQQQQRLLEQQRLTLLHEQEQQRLQLQERQQRLHQQRRQPMYGLQRQLPTNQQRWLPLHDMRRRPPQPPRVRNVPIVTMPPPSQRNPGQAVDIVEDVESLLRQLRRLKAQEDLPESASGMEYISRVDPRIYDNLDIN